MKTMILMRQILCVLSVILCCLTAGAQEADKSSRVYNSKTEIYDSTSKGPGFCLAYDTASLKASDQDFFVVYQDCASGLETTTVLMFATDANEKQWRRVYTSEPFRGRVHVEVDNKNQQFVFMSTTRKPLSTMSFASVNK